MRPRLLVADTEGRVFDHPTLAATVAVGAAWQPAPEGEDGMITLPPNATLQGLPGWSPVGFDEAENQFVVLQSLDVGGRRIRPRAVGAVLPPGYTRGALPAGRRSALAPLLPQWAYTAVAFARGGFVAAATRTERRGHWNPARFSTPELAQLVAGRRREAPDNGVLAQLATCALEYRCFTAQNVFYNRDEGALPASNSCNARCIGCISDQPKGAPPASHERMALGTLPADLAEVGGHHLTSASGHVMVAFGQGCEGEPLTRARQMAEAIRLMRQRTTRGSIHINTNASLTDGLDRILRAGLDSVRVSLNSAHPELYEAYYQPQGYAFDDVARSTALARRRRAYVALNLLTFPGVTDREGEVELLEELIVRHRVDQLQTRPLAIDPVQYLEVAEDRGAGGRPLGLREMLRRLRRAAPWLKIGNFSRALDER